MEGPLEMLEIGDILPDTVPKMLFIELFLQKNEKIGFDIFQIELRQQPVGLRDAFKVCVMIDRITFPIAVPSLGDGGAGAEGNAVGEARLRIYGNLVVQPDGRHLAEFLQQVEVLPALHGRDAADFAQRDRPHHDSRP